MSVDPRLDDRVDPPPFDDVPQDVQDVAVELLFDENELQNTAMLEPVKMPQYYQLPLIVAFKDGDHIGNRESRRRLENFLVGQARFQVKRYLKRFASK